MSTSNPEKKVSTTVAEPPLTGLAGTVAPAAAEKRTIRSVLRGDLGIIPVLLTLLIIVIYFQITTTGFFLAPGNIANLLQQIVTVGTISIGAVLVLLLGEIDLSLAVVASACSAVTAVLSVYQGWNPWLAILGGLLTGAVIGTVNGFFIAYLRVPAFIVTLAGSIGYSGFLLLIMGGQATLIVRDKVIRDLDSSLDALWAIGIPLVGVIVFAVATLYEQYRRRKAGLKLRSVPQLAVQLGVVAIVMVLVVGVLQFNKTPAGDILGISQRSMIWIGLVVAFWLALTKTPFGRHVYAVGGSAEAARRAGINVTALKIVIFALASTLAAVGGIMSVAHSTAVATAVDPTLLLRAIAAAVIGGVSLFGGRGSIWAVVLGSLVIGSLENGLTLLNQEQSVKNVVEGAVLLLAVTVDALARRNSAAKGR